MTFAGTAKSASAPAPEPEPEGRSSAIHAASLTLTKLADGLIDPKPGLHWLLGAVGAPGAVIGALVPVREAGALPRRLRLPPIAAIPRSRPAWATCSAVQGPCAIAIVALASGVGGALALGALAALALGHAACSVCRKDALARRVAKGRRGRVSGLRGSQWRFHER